MLPTITEYFGTIKEYGQTVMIFVPTVGGRGQPIIDQVEAKVEYALAVAKICIGCIRIWA